MNFGFPRTIVVSIIVALAVSVTAVAIEVNPVEAGSRCNSQKSRTEEPAWIRVLNVSKGRVEEVKFSNYVVKVMASGEWPAHNHPTKLAVGAQATKQYAWRKVVAWEGRVFNGRCFHVYSDTRDQIYRSNAKPAKAHWNAYKSVKGLRLIKPKKGLFLTGYRTGTAKACASDTNRWKIQARSVGTCARKGWSPVRILKKYLNVVYLKCGNKQAVINNRVLKRGDKICQVE